MQELYCWRCGIDMPMLDEIEFEQVLIELMFGGESLRGGVPEADAYRSALDLYEEFTGLRETNFRALYHHLTARLIEQGDVPLLTWMAVQLWSMLPSVLSLGVSLIYFTVTDVSHLMPQAVSLTSLNALLHLPPDHPYATWAGALDLMLLWTIAITAVACRQLKGVGTVAATLWAAGPFVFIYGAWALAIAS